MHFRIYVQETLYLFCCYGDCDVLHLTVVNAHVRSSASEWVREWERDYYILRLSYEWQLPNTEEYYIGAS